MFSYYLLNSPVIRHFHKIPHNEFSISLDKSRIFYKIFRDISYSYVKITKDGRVLLLLRFLNRAGSIFF